MNELVAFLLFMVAILSFLITICIGILVGMLTNWLCEIISYRTDQIKEEKK